MSGNHTPTPWATAWQLSYTGDEWHFARDAVFAASDIERGIVRNITYLNASSQAEIERLRAGLDALLAVAPDTLGCGHRCSAEIGGQTEDDYAEGLRIARAALSGSKE